MTLYERPANRFVASFIGSPSMNFLYGTIKGKAVEVEGQSLPLAPADRGRLADQDRLKAGQDVIFSMRPEHMREANNQARLSMNAENIEPLGALAHVLDRVSQQKFVAQIDTGIQLEIGQDCEIPVGMEQAHFFGPETEGRL